MPLLLLDAVGTLIYPHPPVAEVYQTHASRFGSKLTASVIGANFRRAASAGGGGQMDGATDQAAERGRWRRIVAASVPDVVAQDELFERLWTHFGDPAHWRCFDDVPPSLARWRSRAIELGIASNFDQRIHAVLDGLPELAAIRRRFVSSELGFAKPDVRFFRRVERQTGLPSGRHLLIGDDHRNDVQGGTRAGWQTVWLRRDTAIDSASDTAISCATSLRQVLP